MLSSRNSCLGRFTTSWSCSWASGSGRADIWEVYNQSNLSKYGWSRGWEVVEPLIATDPDVRGYRDHVNETIGSLDPRLVVIGGPEEIWNNGWWTHQPKSQSFRNKGKLVRDYFREVNSIVDRQTAAGKSFLWQMPASSYYMNNSEMKKLLARPEIRDGVAWSVPQVGKGDGNPKRRTWWATNSGPIAYAS